MASFLIIFLIIFILGLILSKKLVENAFKRLDYLDKEGESEKED